MHKQISDDSSTKMRKRVKILHFMKDAEVEDFFLSVGKTKIKITKTKRNQKSRVLCALSEIYDFNTKSYKKSKRECEREREREKERKSKSSFI
jgi:hypothetical protein